MKVTILGSGNVAEALAAAVAAAKGGGAGTAVREAAHSGDMAATGTAEIVPVEIVPGEIWARSDRGARIAREYGFGVAHSPATLAPADVYIVAVSDSAIAEVTAQMVVPDGAVVAHTAGGVDMSAIAGHICNRAVFYPLQTFSAGRAVDFRTVPVFVEYATPEAGRAMRSLAAALSGSVREADSHMRIRLHVAAVFACNFTNHLYAVAHDVLAREGLSFDVLKPLIAETVAKAALSDDPAEVQTGPAVRGDKATMERHLALLAADGSQKLEEIYKLLSENIWEISKKI